MQACLNVRYFSYISKVWPARAKWKRNESNYFMFDRIQAVAVLMSLQSSPYNYQLAAEHKSLFLLREGAAILLRIAPEFVLPSLVARWLSSWRDVSCCKFDSSVVFRRGRRFEASPCLHIQDGSPIRMFRGFHDSEVWCFRNAGNYQGVTAQFWISHVVTSLSVCFFCYQLG